MVDPVKLANYKEDHCYQYEMRLKNYEEDLKEYGLTQEYVDGLRVNDFYFRYETDAAAKAEMKKFIVRHEWLGTTTFSTSHWFACYHDIDWFGVKRPVLAGVILMSMPNMFSKLLGDNTEELERLISRGACISWSPKNLASSFMSWAMKYMVKTTPYRLFTAYSDPAAKELGTIYQALGFYYLGQKFGTQTRLVNPYTGQNVSDRWFRTTSAYKRFAKDLMIPWQKEWMSDETHGIDWSKVPDNIEKELRDYSKKMEKEAKVINLPPKMKYAFVLGKNKSETKKLRKQFETLNKTYPYPKNRGAVKAA